MSSIRVTSKYKAATGERGRAAAKAPGSHIAGSTNLLAALCILILLVSETAASPLETTGMGGRRLMQTNSSSRATPTKKTQPIRNWNPVCIGIIGGVGPQAGVDVVNEIVRQAAGSNMYYQSRDAPSIYLFSSPKLDGTTQNNWAWATPEEQTANIGAILEEISASFPDCVRDYGAFGLACNTIHKYLYGSLNASDAFVSIIDAVDIALTRGNVEKGSPIYVLGSGVTMNSEISEYRELFGSYDANANIPASEETWIWDNVIMLVQQGNQAKAHENLKDFLGKYVTDKSTPITLTCTELPIAARGPDGNFIPGYTFIDPNVELATLVLERAVQRIKMIEPELYAGWEAGTKRFASSCCSKPNPERDCNVCCESNDCPLL